MTAISRLIPLLLLFASPNLATAAEFSTLCDLKQERDNGCTILMIGAVEKGDADRLAKALGTPAPYFGMYRGLVLDSPGGDVEEAFKVAVIVRKALLQTTTYRSGELNFRTCASACFLIWAAGAKREHYTSATGFIKGPRRGIPYGLGLHRPHFSSSAYDSLDANSLAKEHQRLASRVTDYLRDEAIPASLIEEMMRRSSREILWLDISDLTLPTISVKSPWLEELLIARCQYDPVFDKRAADEANQAFGRGIDEFLKLENDPVQERAISERRRVNGCLYQEIMIPAQRSFRAGRPRVKN
jgi:hypothetical protein